MRFRIAPQTGDTELAVDLIGRAIAVKPNAVYYNNYGNAYKARGDLGKAVDCYHKSLALDPHGEKARYNLGVTLLDQGETNEAMFVSTPYLRLMEWTRNVCRRLAIACRGY